jgi:hypothetical protein
VLEEETIVLEHAIAEDHDVRLGVPEPLQLRELDHDGPMDGEKDLARHRDPQTLSTSSLLATSSTILEPTSSLVAPSSLQYLSLPSPSPSPAPPSEAPWQVPK